MYKYFISRISELKHSVDNIEWQLFAASSIIVFSIVFVIVIFPEWSTKNIDLLYISATEKYGILYIIMAIALLVFLLYVAISDYGNIVLGEPSTAYSTFSWASMLFCAGIGASLVYWGATEWALYYKAPPFGLEPGSQEAILWAASYGMFHWGPIGWSFYCLPALALACSYHVKKVSSLRLSSACEPVLKSYTSKYPGRLVDLFFLLGVIATAATGLGFGTSLVSSVINELTELNDGLALQITIILLATSLISFSVYRGLDKGIKVLSSVNAGLALIFIIFVLILGPTKFILEMGVVSVGHVIQNFGVMVSWTDPLQNSNFVENWTVFYWAWWLAMGPFVGMFVCKISQGRTIRQLILGMLGWGSLGCALFFIILGNYALFMELEGNYSVVERVVTHSPASAIAGLVALLPLGDFWLLFLAVIGLIFMATTYDSASYTLAAGATKSLARNEHPAIWHQGFWALVLGLLPISLLFIGGLRELQTASLVASFPLLGIYTMLFVSTMRMLKEIKLSLNFVK